MHLHLFIGIYERSEAVSSPSKLVSRLGNIVVVFGKFVL